MFTRYFTRLVRFKRYYPLITFPTLISATMKQYECSPTFQGLPVGATFLLHQGNIIFEQEYPGLCVSPYFKPTLPGHEYRENGYFYPTEAEMMIPVYEKVSNEEEERLGSLGLSTAQVGYLKLKGKCKIGCASVTLVQMELLSLDHELIWKWHL